MVAKSLLADPVCWHCPEVVERFPFPSQFKSSLEILALSDYEHKKYFKGSDIPALDVDGFEKMRTRKGENQRTIDAFIGICNEKEGKRVNQRLLPVELRLKYKSDRHLDSEYLNDKLKHSYFLVKNIDETVTIDSSYSLVFDESVIQQMIRWLESVKRVESKARNWQALSPEGLCNYINFGKDFPYTPRKEGKGLADRVEVTARNKNIRAFETLWPEVRRYIETSDRRYEHGECRFLSTVLADTIRILEEIPLQNEDDILMFDLLKEEVHDVTRAWLSL